MPIKILAPQVVSKIAAGEVVERPASVVKELLENALDAGATNIMLEIRSGGINMIKVIDDGIGIRSNEVELAFSRHATSKLDTLEELERLTTLGFRGEALPSMATVADVEIVTRIEGEDVGTYLRLINGSVDFREGRSRTRGTTITVHNLFRHFPARLKFLKSLATESGHIANLVTQYALAYPEVKFNLVIDGRRNILTSGKGELKYAVAEIYGLDIAEQMLEFNYSEPGCSVTGLTSQPSLSRSNRNYLSFFVNRRWIHSGALIHAIEFAYQGLLMTGKHPVVIANIRVPPQDIDVNVHPSKIEVKFRNSQLVHNILGKAVKKSLAGSSVPEIKSTLNLSLPQSSISLWDKPVEAMLSTKQAGSATDMGVVKSMTVLPVLRLVGQLATTYIMAEGPQGLYLIDQHAAHERILFEKILAKLAEKATETQGMLEPLHLELSPKQEEMLQAQGELLQQFGLNLEHFGGRSYLLRAVPAVISGSNIIEAVLEILDSLGGEPEQSKREEKLAQSLACHGAIKSGQILTGEEMRELLRQLEQAEQPRTCPHGRPTMIYLSSHQLEKEFGRIR
jgi:DNA mismatch repair protein MutL